MSDKCKICGEETDVIFNIDFVATPICEFCARAITIQQVAWYVDKEYKFFPPKNPEKPKIK
jgi:hypothetical protein